MKKSNGRCALVIGGSGLIGKILIQNLLESNKYERVRVLVRSNIDIKHPKLEVVIFNFDNLNSAFSYR